MNQSNRKHIFDSITDYLIDTYQGTDATQVDGELEINGVVYYYEAGLTTKEYECFIESGELSHMEKDYKEMNAEDVEIFEVNYQDEEDETIYL